MTVLPRIPDQELDDLGPDGRDYGGLRSERGHLPLMAMAVTCDVTGLFATTKVRQTFLNVLDEPIEATYVFPLPDRAAVSAFSAVLGDRRIVGLLKERQAARDDYDTAIAAGQRAAIVEEDRPGVFSARVGNLRPGERGEVELTLVGPLPYDDGVATLRFPLVVAPRYIPGVALDEPSAGDGVAPDTDLVPDASRISPPALLPGHPNPVRLELAATIDPAGFLLSDLRSSLHTVRTEHSGVSSVRVELRPGERLDRDFVLRFGLAGAGATTSALAVPDHPGAREGTVTVTVVPPRPAGGARHRDVAVVLDRSGSMGGWKMVAARRAAARIVDGLGAGDRMAVLAFDDRTDRPDRLGRGLVPASDRHRFAAVEFLAGLEARGGTEMQSPLAGAAALLAAGPADRDRVLVLVTDGQVGQEDVVLAALAPHLGAVRVFALGIDQAVNAGFLQRLAAMSGGRCELVESEDRLDEAMTAIHRQVAVPVVAGLKMELDGAELMAGTPAPARPPDCTEGSPCVLAARYRAAGGGPIVVRVTGTAGGGNLWTETVEAVAVANPAVTATWARAHIRDLEDRYAAGDRGEALASAIVAVSLAHGVLSRFTAFVAVDPVRPDEPVVTPHRIIQPVEMPAGWAAPAMAAPAGGMLRRMASMAAPAEGAMPMASAPAPAPWPAVWLRVEEILRRIEEGDRVPAGEIDTFVDELRTAGAPEKVTAAVAALAAGVRDGAGGGELSRLVRAVRAQRPGRRRFWKGG